MMKPINFLYVFLALHSHAVFSGNTGSVVNVTYTGPALSVDIAVCTNINDPITCEKHTTTNSQITLRPAVQNFHYKYMGFKILTPGYIVQGPQGTLPTNRYGYVLTPGSSSTPAVYQIGEITAACNGLTAVNLGDGINWRCYNLAANSRISCILPPKNNCVAVAAAVPSDQQINTLYAAFGVANSQNFFLQSGNSAIGNMPDNPFFGNVLQVNTPVSVTAASWSTDWGTTNYTFATQQLCPCVS